MISPPPRAMNHIRSLGVVRALGWASLVQAIALALVCLSLASAPASAQNTNPDPDPDCGLPKGLSGARRIYSSVTYTLTADCQQEWRLSCDIPSTSEDAAAIITIEGNGNTITSFSDQYGPLNVFSLTGKCALALKDVTIAGGGYRNNASIFITSPDVASSFTNVTFSNSGYIALNI